MDLEDMKYADLRRLAKKLGVKANMKSDKLILAIRAVAEAGPGDLTSDDEPAGTEPVTKLTKSIKAKSGRLLSETTTDESQDEEMKVVEKSKKGRRGRGKTDATVSTTDESQDEANMAVEEKPRGRNGRRKKTAVEEQPKDLTTVGSSRQRSSSRKKTPETTKVSAKPTSNTPGVRGHSNDKPTPGNRTVTALKKSPLSGKVSPALGKTPLVSRKTPVGARKTPVFSKKTPMVSRKTPVPARRTPIGRKSPVVKKTLAKKSGPQGVSHRRTRSGEKPAVPTPADVQEATVLSHTVPEPTVQKREADRKRKRSSDSDKLNTTFDLEDDPPEAKKSRPSIDVLADVTIPRDQATAESEDVGAMINTMRSSMSKDEMKEALEAAISKSVRKKHVTVVEPTVEEKSHIPRFVAYVKNLKKPVTPGNKDWSRIHKAQFDKMDSIDDYLKKRKERTSKLLQSVDKAKQTAAEGQARIGEASSSVTRSRGNEPVVASTIKENENKFVPSVTSVADIETNFPALSKLKTPRAVTQPLTSLNVSVRTAKKSTAYDGDQSLLAKTPKPFDLKASLSKPLSWKPYTGKLKPVDGVKSMVGKQGANKKVERRQDAQQKRKDAKLKAQMKRRGILA